MSPANNPLLRSLLGLARSAAILPYALTGTNDADGNPQAGPIGPENPLAVTVIGGGTVSFPIVTATYTPSNLTVGATPMSLVNPPNATDATVYVVSGSIKRAIGADASTSNVILNPGDIEQISGQELSAYSMIRSGGVDAQITVEYRRRA